MISPSSTYRIQFQKEFNFKDFKKIIPYLKALGVGMIYASPIFEAISGSTHGYDIVNPLAINPEIGTENELIEITQQLKSLNIGWMQDIVPNHMAFTPTNLWLMDVLEKWDQSAYFNFFDINYVNNLEDKRLMVPFLGETLNDAIELKKLKVIYVDKKLYLNYADANWPVNEHTYELVLRNFTEIAVNNSATNEINLKLEEINTNVGLLRQIVDRQYYRLCNWQETEHAINYRRFFTVNSLICVNIQDENVFTAYHQYIFSLVKKGIFQGLRIDHIDGLFDPKQYLDRLKAEVGDQVYIVAEKILGDIETMPSDWPIAGNTGYDFLAKVNNLFTNKAAKKTFDKLYSEITKKQNDVSDQVLVKKTAILYEHMEGELNNLHELFISLRLATKKDLDALAPNSLKDAIGNFLIHCPIYRYYGNKFPLIVEEEAALKQIFADFDKTEQLIHAINLISAALLDSNKRNNDYQQRALYFYQRCMQFSGPLTAKGVEDTLMYTYNRFIGHTEVGDTPNSFGLTTKSFHKVMHERLLEIPFSINATSTHDTKRGEDVRARLNVLTDVPELWRSLVLDLKDNNCRDGKLVLNLHQNDAYLIYQTVLGALPYEQKDEDHLQQRLENYIEKALREAKKRSDWATPNENYELDAKNFANSLLDKTQHNYKKLQNFLALIKDFSIINSLSQLVLKCTCPGIPDIYQGTELWDMSLVDPDNRRAVDYKIRVRYLKEIKAKTNLDELWKERDTGKIKLWLTQLLLTLRIEEKELFDEGEYFPLKTKGKYKKNVIAFLRRHKEITIMVVIPLGLANLTNADAINIENFDWKNTRIVTPKELPSNWENILTKKQSHIDILHEDLLLKDLLSDFPIAILKFEKTNQDRGAGILLHISSLPSKFGIGDLGPSAFKFVDFLVETKQKFWQMLPLNPTGEKALYSPYSASSAFAGNVLFISPEFLAKCQLLNVKDLKKSQLSNKNKVDFEKVENIKCNVLHLAYKNFIKSQFSDLKARYLAFCETEASWLNDYALFISLRKHHNQLPWNEWPTLYKLRDQKALNKFEKDFFEEIDELKWQQFIFHLQWHNLRDHANKNGVSLIGDLPFYIGYDSADVWANHQYFKLNDELEMDGIAGVPPDVFNDNGQLWGMPVFRWDKLKRDNYLWWMDRIKKNIELFDYLRLDHFRAFDTYWEVPSTEEYAINGSWKQGPGSSFFDAVYKECKELPFIVEDLGSDLMGTEKLRASFNFPGMRVLEFGFGSDLVSSNHIPHNYNSSNTVVYVGTHDNNTALGWYRKDLSKSDKKRLNIYAGQEVREDNVNSILIRIAYASTAKIAIIQMQDLLNLDEKYRMNIPATVSNNWLWRMKTQRIEKEMKNWLKLQTILFGRG